MSLTSAQEKKKTETETETEANFSVVWATTQVKNSSHHTTCKLPSSANISVKLFTHKMQPYPM
jgi:hypothetical protein